MTSIEQNGHVEFRFFRPNVNSVSIIGDFNGWDQHNLVMNSDGQGWWTASLRFDAGEYRFRYLADGELFSDYASYGVELTATGFNSVLRVPEQKGSQYQYSNAKQVA